MADFKEQTNSLMVRVIPIYLAAELLCPNLFLGGEGSMQAEERSGQGESVASVMWSGARSAPQGLFDSCPAEQQQCGGGLWDGSKRALSLS